VGESQIFVVRHHTGLMVWSLALLLALHPPAMRNPYNLGILNLIGLYVIVVWGSTSSSASPARSPWATPPFSAGRLRLGILTATYGFPAWPAMALTALAMAVVALVLGVPTLRLSGHYLAMGHPGFQTTWWTAFSSNGTRSPADPAAFPGCRPCPSGA